MLVLRAFMCVSMMEHWNGKLREENAFVACESISQVKPDLENGM